ncbi:hypothetical protein ABT173_13355 [Streptomyces sp. NPDC001795]|uniref:hypothetical protein n=1 Tax=Streptomyces sp. NPDC001795 TaxID=3154525 RepID=UPI003326EA87
MTTPPGNPYAQQANPYASQGGYPHSYSHPNAYAAPGPGYPQGHGPHLTCRFCGTAPAVDVTFRAHRGLLVLMTFRKLEGPMCHGCGMQAYKRLTTETLWQGWWSPASLVVFTPFTLIWNVIASAKVKKLQAAPVARQSGQY